MMKRIVLIFLLAVSLSACGVYGNLYLPSAKQGQKQHEK